MLTCIARSKQGTGEQSPSDYSPRIQRPEAKHTVRVLSSQIKDMVLKASGAYRHWVLCPNSRSSRYRTCGGESDATAPEKAVGRTLSSISSSSAGMRELEARLKGISSGIGIPALTSGRRTEPAVVFVEESEPKEWVAQVEPGVLITFLSLPRGANDLKRIRFCRDMFNKWEAQRWWAENSEKVIELYNVQRFNPGSIPIPSPRSEDESSSKVESTPSLGNEPPPQPTGAGAGAGAGTGTGTGMGDSSSDSADLHGMQSCPNCNISSPPEVSSTTSDTKTETSSLDISISTSSSQDAADHSVETSVSDADEWVEEDEAGVHVTIRALPGGRRELRRVRFSREIFGEMHARLWWEENRARIHRQYL